mmetsp:Transcript_31879/g.85225  ORF Transcript_31879/g.85225 Transcript_31879/m.85225 type:complete len:218 (+) Transcript_31879:836-1489(+)
MPRPRHFTQVHDLAGMEKHNGGSDPPSLGQAGLACALRPNEHPVPRALRFTNIIYCRPSIRKIWVGIGRKNISLCKCTASNLVVQCGVVRLLRQPIGRTVPDSVRDSQTAQVHDDGCQIQVLLAVCLLAQGQETKGADRIAGILHASIGEPTSHNAHSWAHPMHEHVFGQATLRGALIWILTSHAEVQPQDPEQHLVVHQIASHFFQSTVPRLLHLQ